MSPCGRPGCRRKASRRSTTSSAASASSRACARTRTSDASWKGILLAVNYAALTARCRARLDELDLPRPFDVRAMCADLGRRRGRPVELVEMALPADAPSGLWLSTGQRDYIVYEQATSLLHQEHIILHELSHMLCGHTGGSRLREEHASRLFPQLDSGMIRRVLGRAGYTSEEEQEAE